MKLKLKSLRKDRHLTIDQLADMSGISRGYISLLENGRRQPSSDAMQTLASTLKVRVSDLIDEGQTDEDVTAIIAILLFGSSAVIGAAGAMLGGLVAIIAAILLVMFGMPYLAGFAVWLGVHPSNAMPAVGFGLICLIILVFLALQLAGFDLKTGQKRK